MTASDDAAHHTKTAAGAGRKSKSPPNASQPAGRPELLTLTINVKTGQIVKVERVESSGARHELSKEERARLAQEKGEHTLEALIEEVFEAGIASVLGEGAGQPGAREPGEGAQESEEEAELRHLLLQPLIEGSAVKHLMRRHILTRATLGTLLRHDFGPASRSAESRPLRPSSKGSASKQHPRLGATHE